MKTGASKPTTAARATANKRSQSKKGTR